MKLSALKPLLRSRARPRSRWRKNCRLRPAIRVLIVDDHMNVRQGLQLIFETEGNVDVVGEAENGREGVALAAELDPDIILMDLQMPEMDGLNAVKTILAKRPESQDVLSDRELEVLRAEAEGGTNQQNGLQLGISERTVRAHLTSVYNKFGVSSRGAAIAHAAQLGLLE